MPGKFRVALAVACLAGVGGLLALGRRSPGTGDPSPKFASASRSNRDCRQCHAAVWSEWESSQHGQSWTSPNVQGAFRNFGHDRQCESCHAPEPVAARAAETPVALRAEERESGVDCLSCHALPGQDAVAAARTITGAPCHPVETSLLTESNHCAACHTAISKDWQASRYRAEGKTCQTCHMPAVASRAGGRSHVCLGGHDDALVRSGARMTCERVADEIVVSIVNHATGHNFPGERHNRVLLLQVIQRDAEGEITQGRQTKIKDITPFRGESSADRIQVDETFEARFPVAAGSTAAEVQLLYKRFPFHADRDALIVHETSLDLSPVAEP